MDFNVPEPSGLHAVRTALDLPRSWSGIIPGTFEACGLHQPMRNVVYVFGNAGRGPRHNYRRWFDANVKAAGLRTTPCITTGTPLPAGC